MRYLFVCLLLFAAVVGVPHQQLSFAQAKPVTLNGTLQLNTGEAFPYKVVLTEADGIVSGYSFTYSEPNDTKTKIQGKLDRMTHTLTFKETEIVYSHTVRTKAYMCLIDAKLKYTPGGKDNTLKGSITSMEADKTSCTGGKIVFSNDDEIQFLFAYHDKLDTIINMKRKVATPVAETKEQAPATEQPLTTDKVTTGIEKTYEWHTDTVVIDVWDGGTTDGDRITIQFNGKAVLTDHYLTKQKKQLRIPLAAGVNTVTIIAENEGSDPPNTASMLFTDGAKKYSVLAYNNKGQRSLIKIKRVRP